MNDLTYEQLVKAPASDVYAAFTNSTALRQWLCDVAHAIPQVSGRIYFAWNSGYYASGEYIRLDPERAILFSYFGRNEPGITEVEVTLHPIEGGTLVRLTHRGAGPAADWATFRQEADHAWRTSLPNLASIIETGADLRITTRPMLGVNCEDITDVNTARHNLSVKSGALLTTVFDGLGAKDAGLQPGDVLTRISGLEITTCADLLQTLGQHKAGDPVEFIYQRGGEKLTTVVTLSARSIPAVPETPQALGKVLEDRYKEVNDQIADLIAGYSEAELSAQPEKSEWSAKEVLSHLVFAERLFIAQATDLVGDAVQYTDAYYDNQPASVQAIVEVYKTSARLMEEIRNMDAEIVAFVSNLPAEIAARKRTWWWLSTSLQSNINHTYSHIPQIKAAADKAKN
ncbi:MAG TPA: DinB family protein [Longilinea sp.]|nr:DinB family protein [Longilinea sp.]